MKDVQWHGNENVLMKDAPRNMKTWDFLDLASHTRTVRSTDPKAVNEIECSRCQCGAVQLSYCLVSATI